MKIERKENVVYKDAFMLEEPVLHKWRHEENLSFTDIAKKADIPLYKAHSIYKEESEKIRKAQALITNPSRVYWKKVWSDDLTWGEYRSIEDWVLREVGLRYYTAGQMIVPLERNDRKWSMKADTMIINDEIGAMMYEVMRMKRRLRNAVEIKFY